MDRIDGFVIAKIPELITDDINVPFVAHKVDLSKEAIKFLEKLDKQTNG